jgi:tRNA pseudouridine55 synthase
VVLRQGAGRHDPSSAFESVPDQLRCVLRLEWVGGRFAALIKDSNLLDELFLNDSHFYNIINEMDGLLIVNKPSGITSHDVVARVRKILGTRKVGHTGTLDPFATGVLVLLIGKATRLARFLDKDEKEYDALIRLGFETDTGDRTGKKIDEEGIPHPFTLDTRTLVVSMIPFTGESEQVPPMYSAKKVEGKKLYEHARQGKTIERSPIKIQIDNLMLFDGSTKWPGPPHDLLAGTKDVGLRVVCSAGTYIRTLTEDIAKAAGNRAHLAELDRTRAGRFTTEMAVTLDHLEQMDDPASALLPMEEAVAHLPAFRLWQERVVPTRNGMSTKINDGSFKEGIEYQMLSPAGELVAIGEYSSKNNSIRPILVLS